MPYGTLRMLPDCQQSLHAPIAVHPRPAVDHDGVNWPLAGPLDYEEPQESRGRPRCRASAA